VKQIEWFVSIHLSLFAIHHFGPPLINIKYKDHESGRLEKSMDLVETIYKLTQTFRCRKISLTGQMQIAVVSIPSNID
jgi:hypothetical protein